MAEENVGAGFVVVPTAMERDRANFRLALHFADEGRDFRETEAGSDDADHFQDAVEETVESVRGLRYRFCVHVVRGGGKAVRAEKALLRCKTFDSCGEPA
ncbi:MAG: hypothetical protein WA765_08045 [Candidatus Acidiferrum sp.]